MTNEEKFKVYVDQIEELITDVSYLKGLTEGLKAQGNSFHSDISFFSTSIKKIWSEIDILREEFIKVSNCVVELSNLISTKTQYLHTGIERILDVIEQQKIWERK